MPERLMALCMVEMKTSSACGEAIQAGRVCDGQRVEELQKSRRYAQLWVGQPRDSGRYTPAYTPLGRSNAAPRSVLTRPSLQRVSDVDDKVAFLNASSRDRTLYEIVFSCCGVRENVRRLPDELTIGLA